MSAMNSEAAVALADSEKLEAHCALLVQSYERVVGDVLVGIGEETNLASLWSADFGLVSHGVEADPVFNFGNHLALTLFERSFEEFVRLPSRKSSPQAIDTNRVALLDEVTRKGFISSYTGTRVSASGREFVIEDAVVWNLIDGQGFYRGQAAKITQWHYLA